MSLPWSSAQLLNSIESSWRYLLENENFAITISCYNVQIYLSDRIWLVSDSWRLVMTTERTASTVVVHGVELDGGQGVGFVPLFDGEVTMQGRNLVRTRWWNKSPSPGQFWVNQKVVLYFNLEYMSVQKVQGNWERGYASQVAPVHRWLKEEAWTTQSNIGYSQVATHVDGVRRKGRMGETGYLSHLNIQLSSTQRMTSQSSNKEDRLCGNDLAGSTTLHDP